MTKGKVIQISQTNPKVMAVIRMIKEDWENNVNSKIIVWAHYIEDIRVLSGALAAEGINHVGYHRAILDKYRVKDSQAAEDVININRDCKVLIANPASAGLGQSFYGYDVEKVEEYETRVDHEIYFSCNWSAIDRIQSEDRPINRELKSHLRVTDLVVPGTIDEEIRERVSNKRDMAISLQDVKAILNNVLRNYK